MIHRLHRKAACAFMAVTTAAAMIFPVGAATIYFDVSPNDWYYDAVEYGVTTGLLADTIGDFNPNQAATRAMLYTMLHHAAPGCRFSQGPGAAAAGCDRQCMVC